MKFNQTPYAIDITVVVDYLGENILFHKDTKENEIVIPINCTTESILYYIYIYIYLFICRFNIRTVGKVSPVSDIRLFQKYQFPPEYSVIEPQDNNYNTNYIDVFNKYTNEGYNPIPVITSLRFIQYLKDKPEVIEDIVTKFIKHLENSIYYTKLISNSYNRYVLEDYMFDVYHTTSGIVFDGNIIECNRCNNDFTILPINMIRYGKYIWSFKYLSGNSICIGLTKSEYPYYYNHYIKSDMFWLYSLRTSEVYDLGNERKCKYKLPEIGDEIHFYYNSISKDVYIAINHEPFVQIFKIDEEINHLHPIIIFQDKGRLEYLSLFFSQNNPTNIDFQNYPISTPKNCERLLYDSRVEEQCDNVKYFDVAVEKDEESSNIFSFNSQSFTHFIGGIEFFPINKESPKEAILSIYIFSSFIIYRN